MITVDYSLTVYRVDNLHADTCAHCVEGIRVEIIKVPGVVGVDVNRDGGSVSVLTDGPVPADAIHAAILDAGCTPAVL